MGRAAAAGLLCGAAATAGGGSLARGGACWASSWRTSGATQEAVPRLLRRGARSLSATAASALRAPCAGSAGLRATPFGGAAAAGGSLALLRLSRRRRQAGGVTDGINISATVPLARTSRASSSVAGAMKAHASPEVAAETPRQVPVVLLSGFLGAGKTSLLKHWLENAEGRIGIVVNDVGAVNIDAKLVKQSKYGGDGKIDAIQLQNGCACCSLGDELLVSIYDLLDLATEGEPFSQIVVELSGVAEPQRVCDNIRLAGERGDAISDGVKLGKVVTLLDASTFCSEYMQWQRMIDRPDLMDGDGGEMADCQVVELLVEQTEAADVVVLNKTDLATAEQLAATRAVVAAINPKAVIMETSFGMLPLKVVLAEEPCSEPGCSDPSHGHGHEEASGHAHEEASGHAHEEACSDPSHGHGHEEASGHAHEEACSDPSHGHGHEEASGHGHEEACSEPGCTDPSHGHENGHENGHEHGSSSSATTAEARFGITSFTYTARRPFQEKRFTEALQQWPVPKQDDLGLLLTEPSASDEHPLSRVMRSKGFCWLECHPSSRMYWSHAGKNMVLNYEGLWWGAMKEDQLMLMEKMATGEYERARQEDWSEDFGDRRQEIVFIGQRIDKAAITALLDNCLLTDDELAPYMEKQEADKQDLSRAWAEEYRDAETIDAGLS
ncbi:unnamed protein product [Polarella glacialis]|uniref:CobW C-terminal domain-containing protein n=1 Tax=Polarella glacialis TaxID=89957 RepID=A0A813F7L6_POLGL|nr:unnamed protein product [Polarella glacialis]